MTKKTPRKRKAPAKKPAAPKAKRTTLKPGDTIERTFKGRTLKLTVTDDG